MYPYKEQLAKLNFNPRNLSVETQGYIKMYNDNSARLTFANAKLPKCESEESKTKMSAEIAELKAEIDRLQPIIEERILLEYKDMNPEPTPEPTPEPSPAPEPAPEPIPAPAPEEKKPFRLFRFKNKE